MIYQHSNKVSLVYVLIGLVTVFWLGACWQDWLSHRDLEYRPVTARGELGAEEQNTIEVFQQARASVVFITTLSQIVNPPSRSVFSVPAGTGSGLLWDAKGHIVTNINPGNSGGPLLDSAGRLIGINTAIYSPSGASAGIGFAVPVDTIASVVPRLIHEGRYGLPDLGSKLDLDDGTIQELQ